MKTWSYHNPVAVTFGWGSLSQLPKLLKGRRAVVVTFPQAKDTGLLATLVALIGGQLAGVIDDVQPNPELSWVTGHYAEFWEKLVLLSPKGLGKKLLRKWLRAFP